MGKLNGQRYHFLYKSTNLINGKFYVGIHSTYNLEDGYLGSGKRLKRAVKKYGKENFKCEILEFFESRKEVLLREKEVVNEQFLNDPLCMNLQPGGGGGFSTVEHGLKCSTAGGESYSEKLYSDKNFFKTVSKRSKEVISKLHANGKIPYVGGLNRIVTEETKRKIGKKNSKKQKGKKNSQFGTCWVYNKKENKKINKKDLSYWINLGWQQGRKMNLR